MFSQDVSLKELAPSGDDSFELILCLAKLAADIFLADLAFSLAEEFDDEEFVEIPSSELDLGITGLWRWSCCKCSKLSGRTMILMEDR